MGKWDSGGRKGAVLQLKEQIVDSHWSRGPKQGILESSMENAAYFVCI